MDPEYVVALSLRNGRVIRRGFDVEDSAREFLRESESDKRYVSGALFDAADNVLDDFGPDSD